MTQLVRYGLVGVASNGVAYAVYLLITAGGITPALAAGLVYVVAATVGFLGNRRLTFEHEGNAWSAGLRYLVAHAVGLALNLGIIFVMVDGWGYPHPAVQAFAIVVVAGYLFVALKYFVFAGRPKPTPTTRSAER